MCPAAFVLAMVQAQELVISCGYHKRLYMPCQLENSFSARGFIMSLAN